VELTFFSLVVGAYSVSKLSFVLQMATRTSCPLLLLHVSALDASDMSRLLVRLASSPYFRMSVAHDSPL
jgi:hypothetical protein